MRICPSCNQLEESDHDQKACEIDRLRAELERQREEVAEAVKTAFHEGWDDGHAARDAAFAMEPTWSREQGWLDSEARRRLAEEKK